MSQQEEVEEIVFQPGDILFHENELSFHFFVIQDGQVEVFKTGRAGKKVPLAIVHQGSAVGEFAMLDRRPRSATAQALTKVRAARVSDEAYQKLLQELPEWAVAVMLSLVERLRQTNEIIRRAGIVDDKIRLEIESTEFDSEEDTIVEDVPNLGSDDDTAS